VCPDRGKEGYASAAVRIEELTNGETDDVRRQKADEKTGGGGSRASPAE